MGMQFGNADFTNHFDISGVNTSFTIHAEVKWDVGNGACIFGFDTENGSTYYSVERFGGNLLFQTGSGEGTGSAITIGQWYGITLVRTTGVGWEVYLDGISNISVSQANNNSNSHNIGNWHTNYGDNTLDGVMDGLKIWSSALTPAQVLAEYGTEAAILQTGLLTEANLDDGARTTAQTGTNLTEVGTVTDGGEATYINLNELITHVADAVPFQVTTGIGNTIDYTHGLTILEEDLLVYVVHCNDAGSIISDELWDSENTFLPAGQTAGIHTGYKIAKANEPSSYGFDLGSLEYKHVIIKQFRSVGDIVESVAWVNTVDGTSVNSLRATAHNGQSVELNALNVMAVGRDNREAGITFTTADSGWASVVGSTDEQNTAMLHRISTSAETFSGTVLITPIASTSDTSYSTFISFISSVAAIRPNLTLPTSTGISSSAVTLGGTTDVADGIVHAIITANGNESLPTNQEIIDGNYASELFEAVDVVISATGTFSFPSITGLTDNTTYGYAIVHEDAAGNEDAGSRIEGTFTTLTIPVAGILNLTAPANMTFDPLASIHIQFMGTGTLNWTNNATSQASIGSTPNGGTINFINPTTFTINGLINGCEIRLYDNETPADGSHNTELAGVESNVGTSFAYNHSGTTNTIKVQMLAAGYKEIIQEFTLSSSTQTLTLFPEVEDN